MINYGKHKIDDDDISAVLEVLKSDFLTMGPKVPEFEQDLKNFNDCEKCHKEGKCFRILDTNTGICEKCIDGENNQYKCNNTRFLGCPNNKNLNSFDGIKPYFVILKSEDINEEISMLGI